MNKKIHKTAFEMENNYQQKKPSTVGFSEAVLSFLICP